MPPFSEIFGERGPPPDAKDDPFNTPILKFTPEDSWTLGDAFQGTQIFGATGSGKSSGSGQAIARQLLRLKLGGLVLAAVPDELPRWASYADDTKSLDRLVVLTTPERKDYLLNPGQNEPAWRHETAKRLSGVRFCHRFDALEYELNQGGQSPKITRNIVSLFVSALSSGDGSLGRSDGYWMDALRELLTHTFDLLHFAGEPVRLGEANAIVCSAAASRDEAASRKWRKSVCFQHLAKAFARQHTMTDEEKQDWQDTFVFWTTTFPGLAEETRTSIVSTFSTKATSLLRRPLRSLLCVSIDGHVRPERSRSGSVIIVDLPVKEYGETGRLAQVLYKTVWQRAMERPGVSGRDPKPVFLWADESQYFITPEDRMFQQTARSSRVATVYLTQNLPNYYAATGSSRFESDVQSLLGNLQTKIFHANGDPVTNEWAEKLFGRRRLSDTSYTIGEQVSAHSGPNDQALVPAVEFTTLRMGGKHNRFLVDAYVFSGGRTWNSDAAVETGIRISFHQQRADVAHEELGR